MRDIPVNPVLQIPATPSCGLDRLTPAQQAVHNNFLVAYDGLKQNLVRTIFYLRAVMDGKIHRLLGFVRISEYAAHYAGLSEHQTKELLNLGKRLEELPGVATALERGDLTWATAREIARIASPEDQQQWVDVARSVSRQELRERLKEATADPPHVEDPPIPDEPPLEFRSPPWRSEPTANRPRPSQSPPFAPAAQAKTALSRPIAEDQFLSIRMTAEQYAVWESLLEEQRKQRPNVTPAEVMLENISAASAADQEGPSRSPYLIVLLACPDCGQARIPTSRGEADAGSALLAAAGCDGVIERPDGIRRQVVLPRFRRLALKRARYTCEAGNCKHTRFLEVHHRVPVASGGRTELDNLIVLCSRCHRNLHEHESTLIDRRRIIENLAQNRTKGSEKI